MQRDIDYLCILLYYCENKKKILCQRCYLQNLEFTSRFPESQASKFHATRERISGGKNARGG